MATTKLTELGVAKMRPPASGRIEYFDTLLPSFGLRITAGGAKSWFVMLRVHGKLKRITLGRYSPKLGLAEARDLARKAIADAQEGKTPVSGRARRQAIDGDTVRDILAQYIARYQKAKNRRSWREVEQTLKRKLTAAGWMDRPVASIARRDVIELLDGIVDRGADVMANRTLAYLRKMLSWAVERGVIEASPAAGVGAPGDEQTRDRVLTHAELAAVWRASEALGWPFGPIVRLLIATAQRRDEVAHMAWPDVDLDGRLWTLPRELVKADRVHEVPLSGLALEIIGTLPRIGEGLVFPANRARSTNPVSGFSKAKARLDQLSGVTGWRLHDLRRTAASEMARLGHPPHVVAAILNHSPGSTQGITAIYNRHRYGAEKRQALAAWGRELERVLGRGERVRSPRTRLREEPRRGSARLGSWSGDRSHRSARAAASRPPRP
jgi:integrase